MDYSQNLRDIVNAIRPRLDAARGAPRGSVVLMTCGIAGAGKSTLAKAIAAEFRSFTRVSGDAIIASRHGIYNVDYPPSKYETYQEEMDQIYKDMVSRLLRDKRDIVLDRSFYAKKDRDEFKAMIEEAGGRWVLVYLKADRDLLWQRICSRRAQGVNADSALEIHEELLDRYVQGFEAPTDEGEIVITAR